MGDTVRHNTGDAAQHRNMPDGAVTPHCRPQHVPGWGALAFVILVLTVLSGIYMAVYFQPGPADAWKSVMFIERDLAFGSFARAMHGWGGLLLLFFVLLHVLAAICKGAYSAPRGVNWILGVVLLLLLCAFVVTGYLLPWDFRSYWVVQTMINWLDDLPFFSGLLEWMIRGESANGLVPVGRWFALHVCVLPLVTGVVLAAHYALYRRHGSAGREVRRS